MTRPKLLMAGFRERQARRAPDLEKRRWEAPLRYAREAAADTARRVEASRKLFGRRFFRGDCHAHTQHSDGIGTVLEAAKMVRAAGLDFQFITDHWGVTQARECRRHGLWVGQEPGAHNHHLGILGLDHAFTPTDDLPTDVAEARRRGATVFIPHPAGWWPRRVYTEEQKQALYELPGDLLMEILNGANHLVSAYDGMDALAAELWDGLLMSGRKVSIMGNTDAHSPHAIGIAWSGVFAPRCEQDAILRALAAGHAFASEAPLLDLRCGRIAMGDRLRDRKQPVRILAVDSRGLLQVRLVADGRVRAAWHPDGATVFEREQALPAAWRRYVRIEAIAIDGRRAFSNPLYLP